MTFFHISSAETICLDFTLDFALRNANVKLEHAGFTIKANLHAYGFLFQEKLSEAVIILFKHRVRVCRGH